MSVIKKPGENTRSVIHYDGEGHGPFVRGDGDLSYVCGGCRNVLLEAVVAGFSVNVVYRCPKCGAYNETLD